jgi:uncharacterized protein
MPSRSKATTGLPPRPKIPHEVARKLGHYVYLYVEPRSNRPFYVGKGRGTRVLDHLRDLQPSAKRKFIAKLRAAKTEPRLEILTHGLPDAETALCVERAVIDVLGLSVLANQCRGSRSTDRGRQTLSELTARYSARSVKVRHPALLVRSSLLFNERMSPVHMYEATRGTWNVGERRTKARYAFAVLAGVVREVYRIAAWHPAGSTPYATRDHDDVAVTGRWEFTGQPAPEAIRRQHVDRSVAEYFRKGNRNPYRYVGC